MRLIAAGENRKVLFLSACLIRLSALSLSNTQTSLYRDALNVEAKSDMFVKSSILRPATKTNAILGSSLINLRKNGNRDLAAAV